MKPEPILLAETPTLLSPSPSRDDIERSLHAARLAGWRVWEIPPDFSLCETAEIALDHVPRQNEETPTVWLGYIPDFERYEAIYDAARTKNLVLLNSPEQHRTVQEFDFAYPFLEGLTPRSLTVHSREEALARGEEIGFPLFVKGAIQSRKSRGWCACVADNPSELSDLVTGLLDLEMRSRGRVILRELVRLRHSRSHGDFPLGREFRVFLLDGEVLARGFYWLHEEPLAHLSAQEAREVESLAVQAARRLPARSVSLDIGQTEDSHWIVIESGEPGFSGLSQIAPLTWWSRLREVLRR